MKVKDWTHHHVIPKDTIQNLEWRAWYRAEAAKSAEFRAAFRAMCRDDFLFWINASGWIYEPRDSIVAPFITWPFQDDRSWKIVEAIGEQDLTVEKSRDMGATWLIITVMQWLATFHENMSFLMISRIADLVDKRDDPKALFTKLDFQIARQPHWLLPRWDRKAFHLLNLDMNSVIDGEATTESSSIGDRRTAILADEFREFPVGGKKFLDESRDVTRCRIFNSTPGGTQIWFYKLCKDPKRRKIQMHWTVHPEKAKGLYFVDQPVRGHVNPEWGGKKPRSPWYDEQCDKSSGEWDIAQNLDMDHIGSAFQFFNEAVLSAAEGRDAKPPVAVGELEFDPDTLQPIGFTEQPNGRLRLWVTIAADGKPPMRNGYAAGHDVSMGSGASNSVAVVGCRQTCEQVAEFADPHVEPHDFARYCVALARWFHGAEMIWEDTGPGGIFGSNVMESGYRNVYYRTDDKKQGAKPTDIPGWHPTTERKRAVLAELGRAIKQTAFAVRSAQLLAEMRHYIYDTDGTVRYMEDGETDDPSGAGANHGDRVIAGALCWHRVRQVVVVRKSEPELKMNTFAYRRMMRAQREKAATPFW